MLTEVQYDAIKLLVDGQKVAKVAREVKVSRQTLYNWMNNAEFMQGIERYKSELIRTANNKILSNIDKLTDNLIDLAANSTDNRVRFQALKYLLDRSLGTPTASKEEKVVIDGDKKSDNNTLRQELDEIKNNKVIQFKEP